MVHLSIDGQQQQQAMTTKQPTLEMVAGCHTRGDRNGLFAQVYTMELDLDLLSLWQGTILSFLSLLQCFSFTFTFGSMFILH